MSVLRRVRDRAFARESEWAGYRRENTDRHSRRREELQAAWRTYCKVVADMVYDEIAAYIVQHPDSWEAYGSSHDVCILRVPARVWPYEKSHDAVRTWNDNLREEVRLRFKEDEILVDADLEWGEAINVFVYVIPERTSDTATTNVQTTTTTDRA